MNSTLLTTLLLTLCASLLPNYLRADVIDDAVRESKNLQTARLVPRSALIRTEKINLASLSPNGQHLVFWIRNGKKATVNLLHTDTHEIRRLFTTSMVSGLGWSGDGQYLFMATSDGVAVTGIGESDRPSLILTLDAKDEQYYYGVDAGSPHHFFASILEASTGEHVLFRVDRHGAKNELYRSKQRLYNFLAPQGGPLRYVRKANKLIHTFYRLENGAEEPILTCDYEAACQVRGYAPSSDSLFATGRNGNDLTGLMVLRDGHVETVHSDPESLFDIESVTFDRRTGEPLFAHYESDFLDTYGLTDSAREHLKQITTLLDSRVLEVQSSDDQQKWLVIDQDPRQSNPRFYLYDATKQVLHRPLQALTERIKGGENSWREDDIAIRKPFWYTASDGMKLQGYLTLPRGLDPAELPLVVVPHGGPWNRTRGYFDNQAQFLANRGYAVFQPNFRASSGFGRTYMMAANRDFGRGRVHDDIIEGADYLLSRNIGHEDKLAIIGHSFGGFSTIGALAFNPEMFQVGVASAAPAAISDAITHYFDSDDLDELGFRRYEVVARLAVDVEDADDLKRSLEQSPGNHAAEISRPLYVWAGEQDERVDILDVRDFVARLEEMDKEVTFLSAPEDGHGPSGDDSTEAYFLFTEIALHKHIGGRFQSDVSPRLLRYLKRNIVMGHLEL
jgi:dienelactone hydrolase